MLVVQLAVIKETVNVVCEKGDPFLANMSGVGSTSNQEHCSREAKWGTTVNTSVTLFSLGLIYVSQKCTGPQVARAYFDGPVNLRVGNNFILFCIRLFI